MNKMHPSMHWRSPKWKKQTSQEGESTLFSRTNSAETNKDKKESTPSMVVEFDVKDIDWWEKLGQGVKFVKRMWNQFQPTKCVLFQKPLLLAIVTRNAPGKFAVKIGVFLCHRKHPNDIRDDFRMSLLWHSNTNTREAGSVMFGRLLRVTFNFERWRDHPSEPPLSLFQFKLHQSW